MKNKNDFFVIGTDTDVGKTYISSLFFKTLCKNNFYYYKPIQSGCYLKNNILTAPDVDFLCNFNNIPYDKNMVCYTLKEEVSPHLAAEDEKTEIIIQNVIDHYNNIKSKYNSLIIEGAGGLFVPLIRNKFYIYDLIKLFNTPVVVVCSTKVGSINHSILTIKALKELGIEIHGLVFNKYKGKNFEDDNIKIILELSGIKNYLIIKENQNEISDEEKNKFFNNFLKEKK